MVYVGVPKMEMLLKMRVLKHRGHCLPAHHPISFGMGVLRKVHTCGKRPFRAIRLQELKILELVTDLFFIVCSISVEVGSFLNVHAEFYFALSPILLKNYKWQV
jgi:hypothetical protein